MGRNLVSPLLADTAADIANFDGNRLFADTVAECARIGTTVSGQTLAMPARYRFVAGSSTPDNNQSQFAILPASNSAAGRWIRADLAFDLILPFSSATADAATLATIPAELWLVPIYLEPWWEIIVAMSGGSSPAIGLSYTNQATTSPVQGSLLGGASGDGAFPVVSYYRGTPGSHFAAGLKRIVLNPAATIKFDRVASAFAAGNGNAHVPVIQTYAPITPVNPS